MKISELVGDLSYEEIKERKWRHPRILRNNKEVVFKEYIVSEDGIILRIVLPRRTGGTYLGKRIKVGLSKKGYVSFKLTYMGKQIGFLQMHRVLYETWIGKIPKNLQINHKDGVKANNDLNNLEVVTNRENMDHAVANRLTASQKGKKNSFYGKTHSKKSKRKMSHARTNSEKIARHTKITEEDVLKIRSLSDSGRSLKEIHNLYNELIGMKGIYYIIKGKTWTYI
jgi:hypothetical protein